MAILKHLSFLNNAPYTKVEKSIFSVLKDLPNLPPHITEALTGFAPVGILLFAIINLLSLALMLQYPSYSNVVQIVGVAVVTFLLFAAYKPLKQSDVIGWRMIFWAVLVKSVQLILLTRIVTAVISGGFFLYILSQIRNKYR